MKKTLRILALVSLVLILCVNALPVYAAKSATQTINGYTLAGSLENQNAANAGAKTTFSAPGSRQLKVAGEGRFYTTNPRAWTPVEIKLKSSTGTSVIANAVKAGYLLHASSGIHNARVIASNGTYEGTVYTSYTWRP